MPSKLKAIMEAADHLTVGAIAQRPYGIASTDAVQEVYRNARREEFDLLPVTDADGRIRSVVESRWLELLTEWGQVKDQGRPLRVDDLVASDAPVFSILDRIERGSLFCLGARGVEGIVTTYDFNQPAAQYFGFALAIVIEAEIARAIDRYLLEGSHGPDAIVEIARQADVSEATIRRWKGQFENAKHLPLLSWLAFGDKVRILKFVGLKLLAPRLSTDDSPVTEISLADLGEIVSLRNDVAHGNTDHADHRTMCRRLRLAHNLAHDLVRDEERST